MADQPDTTNPSRRLFLATASAGAVFGVCGAASAAEADAIFEAIERHRIADAAYQEACDLIDLDLARRENRIVTMSEQQVYFGARGAAQEALDELLETEPSTLAGVRAVIQYLAAFDPSNDVAMFCRSLMASPLIAA